MVNELGLRDTTFNRNADVKILLLGDSVSWGDGVALPEAYPYLLEKELNKRKPERTFEIINSGVPGYSTFQQLTYLKKRGLALKPNAIILQFCLNDVVERYNVLFEYGGDNIFLGVDTRGTLQGVHGWLVKHSRAYEALARMSVNFGRVKQEYDVSQLMQDNLSPELEKAWSLTLAEIDDIYQLAENNKIPILFVIAPYRVQLQNPNRTNQPQKRLGRHVRGKKLEVMDLLPDFSGVASSQKGIRLFNDANHFSVIGHQLAANRLIYPVLGFLDRNLQNISQ